MIGRVIGTYKIIEKVGEGGMGTVYRAVDQMVEREAAIKVLLPEYAQNTEFGERFRTEAVALAKLNHTAIATLFSFFREGDESFMVMEFVPGETLEARIRRDGRLQWQQAVEVMLWVLDGLRHAHKMGILHRDLKPANIMITPDGRVKVTDFGIARISNSTGLTRESRVVGTLEYLAPERALGKPADARSDIYSLGVVLYEMLTGHLPFKAATDYQLMRAQVEDIPKPPSQLGIQIPAAIERALMGALTKDPNHRYPDAATFAAQFREAVRTTGMPLSNQPTRLAKPHASQPGGGQPLPPVPRAVSSGPDLKTVWMATIAGLILTGALVGGVGYYWKPWKYFDKQVAQGTGLPGSESSGTPGGPQQPAPLEPIAPIVTLPSGETPPPSEPGTATPPVPDVQQPTPSRPPAPAPRQSQPPPAPQPVTVSRDQVLAALEQTDGPVPAGATPGSRPLHYAGILRALQVGRGAPAAPLIMDAIQRRGVNFRISADQIIDLHTAGAPDALIQMLPAAYRAAETSSVAVAHPPPPPAANPAPDPLAPTDPPVPPLRRLREVRRLSVESPKQDELVKFLREELVDELGSKVEVVSRSAAADAILRVELEEDQSGIVVGTAGRVLGMKGKRKAIAKVVDRRHGNVLWKTEAGDRQAVVGAFGDGAKRIASRIAKQLNKDWGK